MRRVGAQGSPQLRRSTRPSLRRRAQASRARRGQRRRQGRTPSRSNEYYYYYYYYYYYLITQKSHGLPPLRRGLGILGCGTTAARFCSSELSLASLCVSCGSRRRLSYYSASR